MADLTGRNAGITGLVDLPGLGDGAKFRARILGWDHNLGVSTKQRMGRGSSRWEQARVVMASGRVVLNGLVQLNGYPMPAQWRGEEGTLTIKLGPGRTETMPIRIDSAGFAFNKRTEQRQRVNLSATLTGSPTWAGFAPGTLPDSADPSASDQEQYAGTRKTSDPWNIQSDEVTTIDVWGNLADTGTAELGRMADVVADAVAYVTGMKYRRATFQRDSIDGGTVTIEWGLNDTKDEIEKGGTFSDVDPLGLDTIGQITEVYQVVDGPPSNPAPIQDTQIVSQRTQSLNDLVSQRTNRLEPLNSYQKREFPATSTTDDPNDLDDAATRAKIWTDTPPSAPDDVPTNGVKLVDFVDTPEPNGHTLRRFNYGKLDSRDKREVPQFKTYDDANDVDDTAVRAKVWSTDDDEPPEGPDDPPTNNVKLIGFTDTAETADGKRVRVWAYGAADSRDKAVLGDYETVTDASGLESTAVRACLDGESISDPSGYTLRDTKVRPLSLGLGVNRVLTVKIYGLTTHQQDIEYAGSNYMLEAAQIERKSVVCKVTSSITPDPSGLNPDSTNLSLYWSESRQRTNTGLWVHTYEFRPLTASEEELARHNKLTIDPALLEGESIQSILDTNAAAPAPPSALISGQVCVRHTTLRRGKVTYLHLYEYGYRSTSDKLVADKQRTTTDPNTLDSEGTDAVLFTGSPPSDPSPPISGLKLVDFADLNTPNPAYTLRVYRFAANDSKDKIELPGTQGAGSPTEPPSSTVPAKLTTLTTTTDDVAALALAAHNANKANTTYAGVEIVKRTSGRAEVVVKSRFDDGSFRWSAQRSGYESLLSDGSTCNVSEIVQVASGLWWCRIVPTVRYVTRGFIRLHRRVVADLTSDSEDDAVTRYTLFGTANDDVFLGKPAGKVMFSASEFEGTYNDTGDRVHDGDYIFEYCSMGHYDDSQVALGGAYTDVAPSYGPVSVANFGWSVIAPTTGDLSVLLP